MRERSSATAAAIPVRSDDDVDTARWLRSAHDQSRRAVPVLRNYALTGTPGNQIYTDDTSQGGGVFGRDPTSLDRPLGCVEGQPQPKLGSTATPCFQRSLYEPMRAQVRVGWALGAFCKTPGNRRAG